MRPEKVAIMRARREAELTGVIRDGFYWGFFRMFRRKYQLYCVCGLGDKGRYGYCKSVFLGRQSFLAHLAEHLEVGHNIPEWVLKLQEITNWSFRHGPSA